MTFFLTRSTLQLLKSCNRIMYFMTLVEAVPLKYDRASINKIVLVKTIKEFFYDVTIAFLMLVKNQTHHNT
jgi:hypothetical protein